MFYIEHFRVIVREFVRWTEDKKRPETLFSVHLQIC